MPDNNLNRFLQAQDRTNYKGVTVYRQAYQELVKGKKRTHWMWFVLPQLRGLGSSDMAYFYGIADIREAEEYLSHPILGQRLRECCQAILTHPDKTAEEILGGIDEVKLRSCATLFAHLSEENSVFHQILAQFYNNRPDRQTLSMLGK